MIRKKSGKKWTAQKDIGTDTDWIASNLRCEVNITVGGLVENIKNSINTAVETYCFEQVKEQRLNQRTKPLMKQRNEMEDKTTEEYWTRNKEISEEIRKDNIQHDMELSKEVI